ncbi:MAG: GGDEF domain-containing phosphodiesterase [Acidobacteriota bacterium]
MRDTSRRMATVAKTQSELLERRSRPATLRARDTRPIPVQPGAVSRDGLARNRSDDRRSPASGQRIVDEIELRRRLQQILDSARELGSVHAVAIVELEPIGAELPEPQRRLTQVLGRRIRSSDTLATLAKHRYALILQHCPLEKATEVGHRLLELIHKMVEPAGGELKPSYRTVIGVVPFSAEAQTVDELIDRGRRACEEARMLGSDRVHVFRADADRRARSQRELLRAVELRRAIEQDQLQLFGQEIVPLRPELPRFVEVLLRMPDGEGGFIPPSAFVLAAERYDLAPKLDRWVVRTVLANYRQWFSEGDVGVTINLSAKSVGDQQLLELVRRGLPEHRVPAERICFEITETAAIDHIEQARRFTTALRQLGCCLALDDFGSGHASFRYLKELDLDILKIDRSFVHGVLADEFNQVMVESTHRIGRVLGIRVVAEGVEDQDVLARIRTLGLDYAQGFVHGRPGPIEALASSVTRRS